MIRPAYVEHHGYVDAILVHTGNKVLSAGQFGLWAGIKLFEAGIALYIIVAPDLDLRREYMGMKINYHKAYYNI